jgi:hypothetical protein
MTTGALLPGRPKINVDSEHLRPLLISAAQHPNNDVPAACARLLMVMVMVMAQRATSQPRLIRPVN